MDTIEFTVTGMTCGNCEKHVREEVSEVQGITVVDVSHETGKLLLQSAGPVDAAAEAAIIAAVDEAGYTAVRAS